MKWIILTGFLVLLGHSEGYAFSIDASDKKTDGEAIAEPPPSKTSKGPNLTTSHISKRSVCKPNQVFQNECNSCKCAADGQTYTCTQAECLERDMTKEVEVFMESEGVDHIERHSVCRPQDTFYIGCNTCHCNYDGTDFSCTNKPCPLPDDVELFHELRLPIPKTANQTCVAKKMFVKDCNICWCNDNGTDFFCTRKVCVQLPDDPPVDTPEELRIIKKECRPDEVFELDCNMCRCNPDGKSFSCTRRACMDPEEKIEAVVEEVKIPLSRRIRAAAPQDDSTRVCQPGEEFRMDCNTCLCANTGLSFSCTRMDCAHPSRENLRAKREAPSQESKAPSDELKAPNEGAKAPSGETKAPSEDAKVDQSTSKTPVDTVRQPETDTHDPGFRCNPGEQFKKNCKDCTCSADGSSVYCTVRLCDDSEQP